MHADELGVDADLVRRLLAVQLPQWAHLPLERIPEEGTDNAIFRLGDDKSVRLPKLPGRERTLELEAEWLPRLAPRLPFAIPRILAVGEPGEGYPCRWAVCAWLDGEQASVGVDDLVALVDSLRAIPTDGAPRCYRGTLAESAWTRARLELLGDARAAAAWDEALAAPGWEGADVWLHGDLDIRNLLVLNGRLAGVLDWGASGAGEPAADVAAAIKILRPDDWNAFRDALGVDDATWARARGWVAQQCAGALTYYTDANNPALMREARRWLDLL